MLGCIFYMYACNFLFFRDLNPTNVTHNTTPSYGNDHKNNNKKRCTQHT